MEQVRRKGVGESSELGDEKEVRWALRGPGLPLGLRWDPLDGSELVLKDHDDNCIENRPQG